MTKTSTVRTILDASSNNIGELCVHVNVNKWSRYKPVRASRNDILHDANARYKATDGNFGFNLPINWDYNKPQGKALLSGYRLGDFRNYEHDKDLTMPPGYTPYRLSSFAGEINIFDATYLPDINAQLYLNTARTSEITLTDLLLNNYYFGCGIKHAGGEYWYKTQNSVAAHAQSTGADLRISNGTYTNFPINVDDTADLSIVFCLSSVEITDWVYQPTESIIIPLPHEIVGAEDIRSIYAFNIGNWIQVDTFTTLSAEADDETYASTEIMNSNIVSPDPNGIIVKSISSWLSYNVEDDFGRITTPPYYNGYNLRVWPNSANTGTVIHGSIVLGDAEGDIHSENLATVAISQAAGPVKITVYTGPDETDIIVTNSCINGCSYILNESDLTKDNITFSFTGEVSNIPDLYYYVIVDGTFTYYSDVFSVHTPNGITNFTETGKTGVILVGGENVQIYITTTPYV